MVFSCIQEDFHAITVWRLYDKGSESFPKVRPCSREMSLSTCVWMKPNPLHRIRTSGLIFTESEAARSIDCHSSFGRFTPEICQIISFIGPIELPCVTVFS